MLSGDMQSSSEAPSPLSIRAFSSKDKDRPEKARRLVLCFDGTGNQFSNMNSNVLQFFKCLRKDDIKQIPYYQTGIGTYTNPSLISPPVIEVSMALDAAIGWNIESHVQDAYRFLMQNYKLGDKISLFGFSRGAYTCRVLCGFLQKVGLLPRENHAQIPFAWKIFKGSDEPNGLIKCSDYKEMFSIKVDIDFVGIWDTVASLGISGKELPFGTPRLKGLRAFRHAVALDERRAKFTVNFKLTDRDDAHFESDDDIRRNCIREVWFAGCHCDVGGGSVPDTTRYSLARIPLRWMITECFRMDTGITFDKEMLSNIGFGQAPDKITIQSVMTKPEHTSELQEERSQLLNLKTREAIKSDHNITLALWLFIMNFLHFFYTPFVYPFRVISYSKWFKGHFHRATPRRSDKDLESGPAVNSKADEKEDEAKEEKNDALSATYDQLSMNKLWWVFEMWPIIFRLQDSSRMARNLFESRINLGTGRKIYGDAWNMRKEREDTSETPWYIEVHRSVRTRMEANGKEYTPKAWFYTDDKCSEKVKWREENNSIVWVE